VLLPGPAHSPPELDLEAVEALDRRAYNAANGRERDRVPEAPIVAGELLDAVDEVGGMPIDQILDSACSRSWRALDHEAAAGLTCSRQLRRSPDERCSGWPGPGGPIVPALAPSRSSGGQFGGGAAEPWGAGAATFTQ
jgi:hypothetical protein